MKTNRIALYNWQYLRFFFALLVVLIGSSAAAHGQDGTMKWSFMTGSWVDSSPALGMDGTVYAGSFDGNLYAINPNGTMQWTFPTGSSIWSSPAIGTDGTLYVGSNDDNLYAINPDGTQKWAFPTGGSIWSSPAIGKNGTLYIGSDDRNLYAISPEGTLKWSFATGGLVQSSPTIGEDGTVYVGSDDGNLYAINGNSGGLLSDSPWAMFHHDLMHTAQASSEDNSSVSSANSSKIGTVRDGMWFLDFNGNQQFDDCVTDRCIGFGLPGDIPVQGDWDGSGTTKIGVYRDGTWFLDFNGNQQFENCVTDRCIGFGIPGDIPVQGDWDGSGTTKIGVYRDGAWFLDFNGNQQFDDCETDRCIGFGLPEDKPATGDWNGSGTTKIGVYRDGMWFLDFDGNEQFEGCETDRCIGFGMAGDFLVAGVWVNDPTPPIEFSAPEALEPAVVGVPYTYSFCQQEPAVTVTSDLCGGPFDNSINPTGGEPPYHFTLGTLGGFPPFGMLLNLNGLLTGAPEAASVNPFYFTVCAVDLAGRQKCRETSLTVVSSPAAGVLSVSPDAGLSSSGPMGGPFSPSSKSYTLTNTGGTTINYSIFNSQNWVSLASTGGSLEPQASTSIAVSINDAANSLSEGIYSGTVSFTNTTNGNGNTSRSVLLTINAAEPPPPPPDGVSFTAETGICTVERFSWGDIISLTVETSGSVSGPVGTVFSAAGLSDLSCSGWSNCERSEGESSSTGWTYSGFSIRGLNTMYFQAGSESFNTTVTCPLE